MEIEKIKYNKPVDFSDIINKDGFYIYISLPGTLAATAANYGVFFTAYYPFQIVWVAECHTTTGTDGSAVELNIERLKGTEALGSGDEIIITDFNLKGTANTLVEKSGNKDLQNNNIIKGDRLALKDTGTLTNVAGIMITMYCKPLLKGHYE